MNRQNNPKPDQTENREAPFDPPPAKAQAVYLLLVMVGTTLDMWSKSAVFELLAKKPGRELEIIPGFFSLVTRQNSGAAFSIAEGKTTWLITISIVALIAVVMFFLFGKIKHTLMQVALALFTAGILGNLFDRISNAGFVRDFLDFYYHGWHWPAFNLADTMLCTAVGLMLIANLTSQERRTPAPRQKKESQDPHQAQ